MIRSAGRTRLTAEQRRETILAAATAVFAERGYQRTKTAEIAAAVGVSEPVIFQNFGTKAELFAAVLEHATTVAVAMLDGIRATRQPVTETLRHLLAPEHLDAMHAPGSVGVLFAEGTTSGADPVVRTASRAAVRRVVDEFAELLAEGRRSGELREDFDPATTAWSLVTFVAGRPLRREVAGDPDLEHRLIELLLRPLVREA
ncbi:TetR family transcriptional regulator [Amycolatopsis lexingtonensis]|uniref:TetR family transcriptional regulator n=1 Tax=Amycolatopsis lexingtonensis TaxID=218822 RepID=UPI003F707325